MNANIHFPRARPASRKALHADIRNSRSKSTESKKLLIDLTPLGRMACNLVENAIKYTDQDDVPSILLTGETDPKFTEDAARHDQTALHKPVTLHQSTAVIDAHTATPRP